MKPEKICWFCLLLVSCTLPAEKKLAVLERRADTVQMLNNDSNQAGMRVEEPSPDPLPLPPPVRKPSGIYRTLLPILGKLEQTIAFYPDNTYRLQERYPAHKDSTVITTGTWAPSDGFIWLYNDQVVRGRYRWKGDTLQYYSPASKQSFSMERRTDILSNTVWQNKKKEGLLLFGIGNEPFWNVSVAKDSLSFQLADWEHPLRFRAEAPLHSRDSTVYAAQNDSTQLRVTVLPYFCNDGMSDFTYPRKIRVVYNKQTYSGCGVVYE